MAEPSIAELEEWLKALLESQGHSVRKLKVTKLGGYVSLNEVRQRRYEASVSISSTFADQATKHLALAAREKPPEGSRVEVVPEDEVALVFRLIVPEEDREA